MTGRETADEARKLSGMLRTAKIFVSDIQLGKTPRWLVLVGQSGSGKTLIAKAIRDYLSKYGEWAYNKHQRPAIDPKSENYLTAYTYHQEGPIFEKWRELVDQCRDKDYSRYKLAAKDYYKIIDDVGAEGMSETGGRDAKPTQFVINQLGKLCDSRLGKWTVWTTNYTIQGLADNFDVRISSRMLRDNSLIVDMSGVRDYNVRLRL